MKKMKECGREWKTKGMKNMVKRRMEMGKEN